MPRRRGTAAAVLALALVGCVHAFKPTAATAPVPAARDAFAGPATGAGSQAELAVNPGGAVDAHPGSGGGGGSPLERAAATWKTDPHGAMALLEPQLAAINASSAAVAPAGSGSGVVVGGSKPPKAARIALLELAADISGALRQAARAAELRRAALALRTRGGAKSKQQQAGSGASASSSTGGSGRLMDVIKAHAALAQDLRDAREYASALDVVRAAQGLLASAAAPPASAVVPAGGVATTATASSADATGVSDPAALAAVLTRIEGALLDCTGDTLAGLKRLAAAHKAGGPGAPPPSNPQLLGHLTMLLRALAGDGVPPRLRALLAGQAAQLRGDLLARGPWTTGDQLPATFIPGLLARPWHDLDAWRPGGSALQPGRPPVDVRAVAAWLASHTDDLLAEFDALAAGGLLEPETECIHLSSAGSWRTYMANAVWHPRRDAHGCSVHTPLACRLLREAPSAVPGAGALHPIRAGYSAVGGRARLLPHYGITNAQLKLHLGLRTPLKPAGGGSSSGGGAGAGTPCASLTVGNETRSWERGRVLFFDDSFVHSVVNDCDEERVVLQFVFAHPDLDDARSPFGGGAGGSSAGLKGGTH
jgi:hypothetical protein